ncbi:hypothetical protein [Hydrogenophaga sp.]|uniref:hypothetical protein n=1 Tax=Hydrogenophaga sp. TaxID=1904254 RepID=UPI0025B8CB91|nr:hypothetical protein [Hydrogenophaga sp.]
MNNLARMEAGCYTTKIAIGAISINGMELHHMYSITTQLLSLDETDEVVLEMGLDALRQGGEENSLAGMECFLSGSSESVLEPALPLLVRLPGVGRSELRSLCSHEFWHINLASKNLLQQQSFVVVGPQDGGLYVPLRGTGSLMPRASDWTMQLLLLGDDCALHARHRLTGMDLDDYLVGCQSVAASSGLNYNPWRIHDQEALDEVAHCGDDILVPGRLVRLMGEAS